MCKCKPHWRFDYFHKLRTWALRELTGYFDAPECTISPAA